MKTEHGKSQLISKDMCQKIKRKIVRAEEYPHLYKKKIGQS